MISDPNPGQLPPQQFKTVYSIPEFRAEVLLNKRSEKWLRAQCHRKLIRTVGKNPYLIPRSEAERLVNGK